MTSRRSQPFLGPQPVTATGQARLSGKVALGEATDFDLTLRGTEWSLSGELLAPETMRLTALAVQTKGRYDKARGRADVRLLTVDSSMMSLALTAPANFVKTEGQPMSLHLPMKGWVELGSVPRSLLKLPDGTTSRAGPTSRSREGTRGRHGSRDSCWRAATWR